MDVEGVVLAAGFSSRTGVYKLTLNVMNRTIIESCLDSMYQVCSKIIVVGGYKFEIISELLSKYSKVKVVYNSDYEDGMFSSVKEGIKHIGADRIFLIPGDHPLVSRETYKKMLEVDGGIIVPKYEGRKGHPVLIKRTIAKEILNNSRYTNLREFIESHGFTTFESQDPGVILDVDTFQDYQSIINNNVLLEGMGAEHRGI
jgi:molybdenum cofactor cytidylyltransferase